jgi:Tfp pilus assembly protein PilO
VTRNIRIVIAVALAAGAGFGYWHFLLGPKRVEADRLARKVESAQAEFAQAQATVATYEKARADYKSNYLTVVRLGKAVPADDDTRSLVMQLDAAASRSGVDFSALQVSNSNSAPAAGTGAAAATTKLPPGAVQVGSAGFAQMPFSFGFQGTFHDLESFFGRLERFVTLKDGTIGVSGRLLRVESLQIAPGDKGFPNLKATITASSYMAPAQQGLTLGATPTGPAGATTTATTTTTTGVAG